uniref:Uncharacterized protein n=1 Tax=Anguilla anguilla TaxID=7936 RepID=A0A0E9WFE8_ANGAN
MNEHMVQTVISTHPQLKYKCLTVFSVTFTTQKHTLSG